MILVGTNDLSWLVPLLVFLPFRVIRTGTPGFLDVIILLGKEVFRLLYKQTS